MNTDNNKLIISVILPTYNRAHLLIRALNSILIQTYQDFEILVIDDCSSDNTQCIIEEFKDDRIIYIRHENNRGVAAARNSGLAAAKGQYIAFLDSDDEWLPTKLQRQLESFQDATPDIGIIYTGACWVKDSIKVHVPSPNLAKKMTNEHLEPIYLRLQSCLIKSECFQKDYSWREIAKMTEKVYEMAMMKVSDVHSYSNSVNR